MGDSTISAMPPAPLPLSIEAVPCVYDGMNMQAPAAAFGIPMAGVSPPTPLAQFQTWIDESTEPPTLRMYVGSEWVALYAFDSDGTLTLAQPLTLADDDSLMAALELKGVVDCSAAPDYPAADQGDFYVVGAAGKIGGASGVDVEAGDTLLCLVDGSAADDQAAVGANWNIAQGNIDGAVTGPASSGDGNFALFDGATGKAIRDGGLSFDTDAALAADSDVRIASQKAVKSYVASNMASLDGALIYRGTIACAANPNYPAADQGDVYVVSAAGKIGGASGINVETGDTLLCRVDGTASGTQAGVGANWTVGQGNIDGAVTGPASSGDGNFALFNGTTGKIVKDGSLSLDTDATFAANSDAHIPSQKAVKSYVATNLAGALIFRGVISCSANPNYPAANQGDCYVVSAAGKIGGASGLNVEIGDTLLCRVNSSASGTQASVGANWTVGQGNIDGAVTGPASASDGNFALFNGTTGKIVKDNSLSLDTDAALAANSDSRISSQKAVKSYVATSMSSLAGAVIYRGVVDCSAGPNYPAANQGDYYVVSAAGKIGGASGLNVETGDTLLCRVNSSASGTQAAVGANWTVGQGNIDGAVTGPASATASNFALFNGTTGKIVQDGGLSLDTNTSLTANSDAHIPSQKAVKSYVDAVNTALGSFETSMLGALIFRGVISCSANPNYPAANQGDYYVVSAAGKIGGASGLNVEIGDTLLCRVNSSVSGTQAAVGANWTVGQGNIDGAVTGPASASDGNFALFNGATGKIVKDNSLSLDTDAALAANSDSRISSQKAVKSYVATSMSSLAGAVIYRGVIDCSAGPNYPAANQGDYYVVSAAGKIGDASGLNVEIGDTLLCRVNSSVSGTQAAVGANWTVGQGNIDGAVTGPASATNSNFALFNGTTGKTIQDGGLSLDTDAALTANSDSHVASQKAVKSYIAGNPSGALTYKGVVDCSANPNYPAANLGDYYVVSVAGKIGGASGLNVEIGDTLLCRVNSSASGTQASVGANWTIGQGNIDGAVTGPASATSSNFALFNGTTGKTIQDGGLSLDTDATLTANSDSHVASQKAVKSYVAGNMSSLAGALIYRGVIDCSANPNYPAANQGDYYVVSVAGKIGSLIGGIVVEAGDTLLCRVNSSASGTQASVGANWTVGQGNIDGAVTGPASATSSNFALFNGTTGKTIQDGGLSLDTDAALTANSDSHVASQKAVKSYVAGNMAGVLIYKGVIDCSTNPSYPAANQGDYYVVSFAGKIGGAVFGLAVESGDTLLCRVNGTASGTQSIVGANWTIGQGNIDGAVTGPASATNSNFALFNGTTGKIIKDSGAFLDTDATMAANSDGRIPSQKAVKSSIGGQPISTDTLGQGQGWLWDGVSSTFRARDNEGQNVLVNSAFDIWQENTSYNFGGPLAKIHIADFWKLAAQTSTSYTASRAAGLANAQYALKIQRIAGQTNVSRVRLAQQFGQAETMYLAGKTVTVSFDFMVGANYSPTSGPVVGIFYGTGVDEDIDLHAGSPAFATGGGNLNTVGLQAQIAAAGTVARIVAPPLAIPTAITEMILELHTSAYSGTAGADDSFTIGNVKMEIGNIATPYRKPDAGDELRRCQRRYQKSFLSATAPAQNAGTMTGEKRWRRFSGAALGEGLHVQLPAPMRVSPTISLFNPSAANGQVRNESGSADCSAATTQNASDSGFEIACTGNSGGAAGDWLGVHWVADARL